MSGYFPDFSLTLKTLCRNHLPLSHSESSSCPALVLNLLRSHLALSLLRLLVCLALLPCHLGLFRLLRLFLQVFAYFFFSYCVFILCGVLGCVSFCFIWCLPLGSASADMTLSSGGVSSDGAFIGSQSSSSQGAFILLLGDMNLRPLPTLSFSYMLSVRPADIWTYSLKSHADLVRLQNSHADQLSSIRFVLVSFLSSFVVNVQAPDLPRDEAICKYLLTFLHSPCFC